MTPTSVSERRLKAFEYTAESIKQLITIAAAIIAFTVTFVKDFASGVEGGARWVAAISWVVLLVSVCTGVLALQSLAGQLDQTESTDPTGQNESTWPKPSIWSAPVKGLWMVQQMTFALGLLITIIFGTISLAMQPSSRPGGTPAAQPAVTPPPADSVTRMPVRP